MSHSGDPEFRLRCLSSSPNREFDPVAHESALEPLDLSKACRNLGFTAAGLRCIAPLSQNWWWVDEDERDQSVRKQVEVLLYHGG